MSAKKLAIMGGLFTVGYTLSHPFNVEKVFAAGPTFSISDAEAKKDNWVASQISSGVFRRVEENGAEDTNEADTAADAEAKAAADAKVKATPAVEAKAKAAKKTGK